MEYEDDWSSPSWATCYDVFEGIECCPRCKHVQSTWRPMVNEWNGTPCQRSQWRTWSNVTLGPTGTNGGRSLVSLSGSQLANSKNLNGNQMLTKCRLRPNAMECHGMPWNAMECHGMPWNAMEWNQTKSIGMKEFSFWVILVRWPIRSATQSNDILCESGS